MGHFILKRMMLETKIKPKKNPQDYMKVMSGDRNVQTYECFNSWKIENRLEQIENIYLVQ